jgi:membrane fusion protein (multidrug efflux system)
VQEFVPAGSLLTALLVSAFCLLPLACNHEEGHREHEHHKILATSLALKNVVQTQQYVCEIHSRRHIEVRALQEGYLEAITVKEGQAVKQGEVLFRVVPAIYKANLDAELAEAEICPIGIRQYEAAV